MCTVFYFFYFFTPSELLGCKPSQRVLYFVNVPVLNHFEEHELHLLPGHAAVAVHAKSMYPTVRGEVTGRL